MENIILRTFTESQDFWLNEPEMIGNVFIDPTKTGSR